MKTTNYLFLAVFIFGWLSCNKEESDEIYTAEVENYIELLKANQYESMDLPDFSDKHIPALLIHINDTNVINKYPRGPSSYWPQNPNYRLGVFALWTIEFIRVRSINSKKLFVGRFPSQNPIIQKRDAPYEWITDHDNEAYDIVRQVYLDWWESNKNKKYIDFHHINPIENTEYRWH
ncbi:MAG: DUF4943 domain-containing protein [Mariniphaga sp.]|nr:DUF4943 domain-containing protein [Mariniphaga sp.]